MRFVVFSVLFLASAYAAATIAIKYLKRRIDRNVEPLSRDVANVCKGIAIGIVMLSHIGNAFGVRYLTPLGSWGVGIFLFLSGYGLELSTNKKGLQKFWRNRIITAWIPYAAAEIIGIIVGAIPEYTQLSMQDILSDLLLIRTVHPFGWYMQCLFLCYIGFYLAHKLFCSKKTGRYVVLLAFSLAFFVLFRSLFKQQAFTFIFGVLVADSIKVREKVIQKPVVGVLALAIGAACLLVRQMPFMRALYWPHELVFSVQVLCLTVGSVNVIGWLYRTMKPILFEGTWYLGLISYEIYLYHAWIYTWITAQPISYLSIAFFFAGSVVLAVPFYLVRNKLIDVWKKKQTV